MSPTNPSSLNPPTDSYSTIFHCTEDSFVCSLRLFEGLISLAMFVVFIRGFQAINKERNNPLSYEDKKIFMLSMAQTLILAVYYLLFEEFFVLATIRNLLIWVNLNFLEVLGKIHYLNDKESTKKLAIGIYVLRIGNFLTWFIFAVGDGSSLENTSFNLGYNCHVMDWVILSGILLMMTMGELYFAYFIIDKLEWEMKNYTEDKQANQSRESEKQNIIFLVGSTLCGALIMFIWDYLAYISTSTDQDCVVMFSGNTFFRKVLCFLLKLISMQIFPCMVYYTIYFKRKSQFLYAHQDLENKRDEYDYDMLNDRAPSDLNRSMTSRMDSRGSLLSSGSQRLL